MEEIDGNQCQQIPVCGIPVLGDFAFPQAAGRHFTACYVLTHHVATSRVVDVIFFTEDDVFLFT